MDLAMWGRYYTHGMKKFKLTTRVFHMKIKHIFFSLFLMFSLFSQPLFAAEWYEGGTLLQATAAQWRNASDADKLASCGDFVSVAYRKKFFKPEIQGSINTMDDIKFLALLLKDAIDEALEDRMPDATVPQAAALLMRAAGWV